MRLWNLNLELGRWSLIVVLDEELIRVSDGFFVICCWLLDPKDDLVFYIYRYYIESLFSDAEQVKTIRIYNENSTISKIPILYAITPISTKSGISKADHYFG